MGRRKGQVLLLSLVLLTAVLGLVGSFVAYLGGVRKATSVFSARAAARQAAQAGLEKALWCLNQASGADCGGTYGSGYAGETDVSVGSSAYYTTSVETLNASLKTVTAVGEWPSATEPQATVTLKAEAAITTTEASFHYGVQSGNGGFKFGNNAHVDGNIYANGNVVGAPGAYATGTVWVAGGTSLTPDQQSTAYTSDFTFAQASPDVDIAQSFKLSQDNVVNKVSFYIKKVGTPSSPTVRILADNGGVPSKTVLASGTLNAAAVTTSYAWVDVTFSTPPGLVGGQTYWLSIDGSTSASKYWIIGSQGNSGYGNGIGMSSANWNASPPVWTDEIRDYNFKVWTGGVATKIDGVHVYEDAHANTIIDSTIDGDAYYQAISGSTVGGASYPGSADPGPESLPITDAQIAQWKVEAENGGTISGDVGVLNGESRSYGPKKITGGLTVDNNSTLTVTGTLYVQGNVTFSNNATIRLDPGYGANSGMIIADGEVLIENNVTFQGSGTTGSYVLVLTTDPSLDSADPAMTLSNNSDNSIFYASKGMVSISNNAVLKEVTAFKLKLENNASVNYESGLENVSFTSGPGGSWTLLDGSTREIR